MLQWLRSLFTIALFVTAFSVTAQDDEGINILERYALFDADSASLNTEIADDETTTYTLELTDLRGTFGIWTTRNSGLRYPITEFVYVWENFEEDAQVEATIIGFDVLLDMVITDVELDTENSVLVLTLSDIQTRLEGDDKLPEVIDFPALSVNMDLDFLQEFEGAVAATRNLRAGFNPLLLQCMVSETANACADAGCSWVPEESGAGGSCLPAQ